VSNLSDQADFWFQLFVLIAIYTAFAAPRGSWCGFSKQIFQDLRTVIIFGLAGVASTCSEW
jgi:hypothetical protein